MNVSALTALGSGSFVMDAGGLTARLGLLRASAAARAARKAAAAACAALVSVSSAEAAGWVTSRLGLVRVVVWAGFVLAGLVDAADWVTAGLGLKEAVAAGAFIELGLVEAAVSAALGWVCSVDAAGATVGAAGCRRRRSSRLRWCLGS